MSGKKNILILTSKTGGGHISLAEALRDLLETGGQTGNGKNEKDAKDTEVPTITIADPQPGFFHLHYRVVSRYALWLWAAEFQFFDTPGRALLAHRIFTRLVRHQLIALLDNVQPDLIITTYPFLSYEVMCLLEQRSSTVPLVMLFSDANGVHAAWLTERRAAATFATTRETYEQALATGFAPERLHLVGWPVRAQFSRTCQLSQEARTEKLSHLNLAPNRFTVFLQGGSEGAARIDRTIENILAAGASAGDLQIILATGTNRNLLERYKNVPSLAILPYTKEIAPFMAASDVIMGKAGPNILFESVMLGKPFIATAYIPGQEQANLPFIQRHGLGWVALQPEEQRSLLTTLIHNTGQLDAMSATINAYRQWNTGANKCIVPLIRSLINGRPSSEQAS
jgi:UDP-N-acetylglucosamine:LPS N-acetylglucosamine transferase